MNTQPAALHYAEVLENFYLGLGRMDATGAAAELRSLHQSCREGWRHADELEQERKRLHALNQELVEALSDVAYTLDSARIWGGIEWTYNPLHPFKYLPARDKARAAAIRARSET